MKVIYVVHLPTVKLNASVWKIIVLDNIFHACLWKQGQKESQNSHNL